VKNKRKGRRLWRMEGRRERAKVKMGTFVLISFVCVGGVTLFLITKIFVLKKLAYHEKD